ncbi:Fur family transcriptional regulator [Caldicellulosiruptor morganii]|uniref:Transcriptional repressor n=1 Tax=Caldicellulosiruptor morganii TaxID=1387555 RepID=A0ABY7BKV0_9FIRM|nr:Fur family transcriptional regulator [Caldicellulosiruptor morganii]WAM33468.1 transcriptional repressor [Caldicellulosiruptor morganii]
MQTSNIKELLNSNGIKATWQRVEILKVLQSSNECLSASQIHQKLSAKNINIDLATVYRVLELFDKKGITQKSVINRKSFFELKKYEHCHYFVCIKCQQKTNIVDCKIDLIKEELRKRNFKVLSHNLEVYGICNKCCGGD